ncbi:hypothetical protein GOP47_0028802 [Adiantum capillus-veneris]|nr:hypothetical protein GOP47_0028802 [Adiantum capillus-veneris]
MFHTFGSWGRLAIDIMLTLSIFLGAISYIMFISRNVASVASALEVMQTTSSSSIVSSFSGGMQSLQAISSQASSARQDRDPFSCVGRKSLMALASSSTNASSSLRFGNFAGLDWSSSSTYVWLVFPLEAALAAIPSITLLAPFSLLADVLNLGALATIMVSDTMEIIRNLTYANMKAIKSMVAVPSAFGVGIYTFQFSSIMIPIEAAMKEPKKLGSVMGMAFVFCCVVYIVFAMLGYAAFGESTKQIITLNLQSGIEAMLIKSAISFALLLAIPLVLNPAFELVERRFSHRKLSLALRTLVVLVVCLLATTVKQFTVFLSLVGSSISCLVGFIIPAAIHIKVMKEDDENPPTSLMFFADVFLIVFGLAFGAFGTTVSFLELF